MVVAGKGKRQRSRAISESYRTNSAYLESISGIFYNEEVFESVHSEKQHVTRILNRLVANGEKPTDQLLYHAATYVKRYSKRMEILSKKGGDRTDRDTTYWASRLRRFLEKPFAGGKGSFTFYILLSALVALSAAGVVFQTVPAYNPVIFPELENGWLIFELCVSVIFFIEIVLRFITTVLDRPPSHPWQDAALDFFKSISNNLDIAATILPTIVQFFGREFSYLNVFRLLRVFRVFFSLRHFEVFEDLEETLRRSIASLSGPLVGLIVCIVLFASSIYTYEAGSWRETTKMFMVKDEDCQLTEAYRQGLDLCPRTESKFLSVMHTMWFVLITFTSVGYGQMVPLSIGGRCVSGAAIIAGSLFTALPIAIVGTNFTLVVDSLKWERKSVQRYIERRDNVDRKFLTTTYESITRRTPIPAQALFRFLRLGAKVDRINFAEVPKALVFFTNLYIQRVAKTMMSPTNARELETIRKRFSKSRKPYSARLALMHPGCDPYSISLVRPAVTSVGTSPACDMVLHSPMVRAKMLLLRQRSAAARQRGEESDIISVAAAKRFALDQVATVGSHHGDFVVVNYGGSKEKLFIEPVAPMAVAIGKQSHDHRTEVPVGKAVRYAPMDVSKHSLRTEVSNVVEWTALDQPGSSPAAPRSRTASRFDVGSGLL